MTRPDEVQAALTEIQGVLTRLANSNFDRSVPTEVGVQLGVIETAVIKALGALNR